MAAGSAHAWVAWLLAAASLYAFGYVAGALLVDLRGDRATPSWIAIRVVAGLLLSTLGFFLALVLSLPWWLGPLAIVGAAIALERRRALLPPRLRIAVQRGSAAAVLLGLLMLSPLVIAAGRMAPGSYPPVFYNVDSAYFLEQVHALATTDRYPPASLSNAGGRRSYHFGTHGMAALISRSSGIAPHQAVFALVLPLLAVGILAAAVVAARAIGPSVPPAVSVPLLLLSVPSFWYSFWSDLGPLLSGAAAAQAMPALAGIAADYELWGVASNVGQNVGAHFLVLASLGGLAAAPAYGWRLPVFLIGTGILVKVSAGVALLGGFLLASGYRALRARSIRPVVPALAATGLCAATFGAFWLLPRLPPEFVPELFPGFHLQRIGERGRLAGLAADLVWLFVPVLVLAAARVRDPAGRSLPLLLAGAAPLLIVNLTRSIDARPGGGGATDDWLQILLPVPFVIHAFVLSVASARWERLGPLVRSVFVLALAVTILPPAWVAARYSYVLLRHPETGHEFVDNRALAEALAVIPRPGSVIVTNDLRYPAQRFSRDNRQMQIPALFGHQAFAVNYAYEVFEFSRSRFALQPLLQSAQWTDAIADAARTHGWTHLLIHTHYSHPSTVPLERMFESETYVVYRFPRQAGPL